MNYKAKIQELIGMINDEKFLRRIYIILGDYMKRLE